jgi:hypothetical protein
MSNEALALIVTPEARRYALRELARRAGVTRDFFLRWQIEVTPQETAISLPNQGSQKIYFRHASDDQIKNISAGKFTVSRARYLEHAFSGKPEDLLLPFVDLLPAPSDSLFAKQANGDFRCHADLLLSVLLTLSRFEELSLTGRDEHGRFPAAKSIAAAHNFVERPIVDEYGLAFEQVLSAILPSWKPRPRRPRIKLTHDIDGVGIPFQFRSAVGHVFKRWTPKGTLKDCLSTFTAADPTELYLVRKLGEVSKSRGFRSAFYWKGSPAGPRDSGYDPCHPKVQKVVRELKRDGFEMGVHPGYNTYGSRSLLAEEVSRMQQALEESSFGGRQHYLRWSPGTWLDWEACNLAYDSTLGFADQIGFRAGTSFPFRPWNIEQNRELNLIEIPLIVMDCTPVKYMKLSRAEGLARVKSCIKRIAAVGGVFTLLWHNLPLMEPEYQGWYEGILNLLSGAENFEVPTSAKSLW